VMDTGGVLYGTAEFSGQNLNGVVYKLTPSPGTTRWTETVLHDFSYNFATGDEDGANPAAGVFMDTTGALYGTTVGGGKPNKSGAGFGTVFELKPPIPGETKWTEYVLYRFAGGWDGQSPESTLIADGAGALYGTTLYGGKGPCTDSSAIVVGCGTVFKLSPASPGNTRWTKTTLYRFAGRIDGGLPHGVLRLDGFGRIYGTTFGGGNGSCSGGCGTAFRLTPPPAGQTAWTKSVIYTFKGADGAFPQGGLIAAGAGNLYGTASGGGTGDGVVFKLIPPGAGQPAWTEIVLHNFNISTSGKTPLGELVADQQRHLFGVAYDGGRGLVGTVFGVTR
jgi:uncharacterized repeat protein (TIGR03803 family)